MSSYSSLLYTCAMFTINNYIYSSKKFKELIRSLSYVIGHILHIMQHVLKIFPDTPFWDTVSVLCSCCLLAFITTCISLGVPCSAPPPGGSFTNEDTTSNEHALPSVLTHNAVILPETPHNLELQRKPSWNTSSFRADLQDTLSASALLPHHVVCVFTGRRLFVHYTLPLFDIGWNKL